MQCTYGRAFYVMQKIFLFLVFILFSSNGWSQKSFSDAKPLIAQVVKALKGPKAKEVKALYQQRQFQPLWFHGKGWSPATMVAKAVLENALDEGLNPKEYPWPNQNMPKAKAIAQAEVMMTQSVLNYMDDLMGDRFYPHKLHQNIHYQPRSYDPVPALLTGLSRDPSGAFLQQLTVTHPSYQRLKKYLKDLRAIPVEDVTPIASGPSLMLGSKDSRISAIAKRLGMEDLEPIFDERFEKAVKTFQRERGISVDGVVGPQTLAQLNITNQDRINQVLATMEKWRWIPQDLPPRYVMINIPSYSLIAHDKAKGDLTMKVIIGRSFRFTPVFASVIDSVRFNPSWYVPRSIAVRDKLEKIQRDPSYLSRKGYRVYDSGGSLVRPGAIDWSTVSPHDFPYRLVQTPGSGNALGKIRFNIQNRFNVYLHDTNEKNLFDRSVRSLSSGCIRIEKPDEMGVFVLGDDENWPLKKVQEAMKGTKTQNVKVPAIPVYITYFTVTFQDDGTPVFSNDIYGMDGSLIKAMQETRHPAMIS